MMLLSFLILCEHFKRSVYKSINKKMTNEEQKQIEKVYGKNYDELEIPTYIRNREHEENIDEHIRAEILLDQEEE